jgi:DNA polymerase (family 10)
MKVPDIGPKTTLRLWKELNVTSVDELRAAIQAGKVRQLKGMGEKSELKMLAGLDVISRKTTRRLIARVYPFADDLIAAMQRACGSRIKEITFAGSLRRRKNTIGDLDLLLSSDAADARDLLTTFTKLPHVETVNDLGGTKASIIARNGMQVDLRVLEPKHWGCALVYFTGSQQHNILIRGLAQAKGYTLNEYRFAKGKKEIFCTSEAEVYERLGLEWIPPELREATGEIEAAREHRLPTLVELKDLKGDMQTHSTWSDGQLSIEQMARAAQAQGLKYLAVTDHSRGLGVVGGLNEDTIQQQWVEIDQVNRKLRGFKVLKGLELEVKADGTLNMSDEILERLDICLASTHTAQKQPREKITARVLNAMRHPFVDAIAHPTGRLIGKREPMDLDVAEVMRVAKETGTILEVDGAEDRLDLDETHVRRLKELGMKTMVDSDAHHPDAFVGLGYGIDNARRGWAEAGDVLNTLEWNEMKKHLKRNRK